jgi:hypothetical protein
MDVTNSNAKAVAEQGVEAKSEAVIALVELSTAQAAAIGIMGKREELDTIARATLAARIKGDFKRYREAEAKVNAQIYDDSSRRGAKWPMSKDAYLKEASARSLEVWNELA